jgi:hypothetical protein
VPDAYMDILGQERIVDFEFQPPRDDLQKVPSQLWHDCEILILEIFLLVAAEKSNVTFLL